MLTSLCLPAGHGAHGVGLLPQQHPTPPRAGGGSRGYPHASPVVACGQGCIPTSCHLFPQDKAILQVLETPPPAANVALDFLSSPVQRGYAGSPRLKRPDFRGTSPKSFSQRFLRQVRALRVSCSSLPLPSAPEAVPSSAMPLSPYETHHQAGIHGCDHIPGAQLVPVMPACPCSSHL